MAYKERDITRLNIDKLPGETPDAYQAFLIYARLQFGDRTKDNVSVITGYSGVAIAGWSTKFNWIERANILDAEEEILIREDRMRLMKQDNIRFAEKAKEIKEKAFSLGEEMVDAARDLLKNTKFIDKVVETGEVETKDGRMVKTHTEIHFKAKVSDIPRLADVGMKITQLAAGLPTEIIESNSVDVAKIKELSREEIYAQIEAEEKEIARRTGDKKLRLIEGGK
jgi:hypothetical protein